MLTWKYYINRGRRNPKAWMEKNHINTYDQLCQLLGTLDVIPPDRSQVSKYFVKKVTPTPAASSFKSPGKGSAKESPLKPTIRTSKSAKRKARSPAKK